LHPFMRSTSDITSLYQLAEVKFIFFFRNFVTVHHDAHCLLEKLKIFEPWLICVPAQQNLVA